MPEPAWVQQERNERAAEAAPRHEEGVKLTRCMVCWNLGPYCVCEVKRDDVIVAVGREMLVERPQLTEGNDE